MISDFPQELLDATIDCVEDPYDHYRTALVAKSWLPRSQSHIFRTITLGLGLQGGLAHGLIEIPPLERDFNNFKAFRDLLYSSPHLAGYVHVLEMGLSVPPAELRDANRLAPDAWQAIEDVVACFLPKLLQLESLALFP